MGHGSDKAPVSSCCPVAAVAPATAHTTNPAWPVSQTPRQPRCTTPTAIQHTTSHNTRAQCAVAHAPACTLAMLVVPLSRLSSRSCQAFPAPTAWRWGTLGATPGRSDATQGLVLSPRETPARLPPHTAAHAPNVSHTQSTPPVLTSTTRPMHRHLEQRAQSGATWPFFTHRRVLQRSACHSTQRLLASVVSLPAE